MPIKGKVETFNRLKVAGWLTLTESEAEPVELELLLDGHVLQRTKADKFREDLRAAGLRGGHCYFEFNLEKTLTDQEAERLRLRIAGSAIVLQLPEAVLNAPPVSPDGITPGLKIFIVGCPRSGTSVLVRALTSALGLPGHGESHVMPGVAAAIHNLRLHLEKFRNRSNSLLINEFPVGDVEHAVFSEVRKFYHTTYGEQGWVDKTPSTTAIFGASIVHRVFPDGKIIVTKRSGIEVVDSFRKKFGSSFDDATSNWADAMRGISQLVDSGLQTLMVDQHDYANRPLDVAEKIANYLGRPDSIAPIQQIFATDRQDKLSSHDWSRHMTLDDVEWDESEKTLFREKCGEMMERFFYPMDRQGAVAV